MNDFSLEKVFTANRSAAMINVTLVMKKLKSLCESLCELSKTKLPCKWKLKGSCGDSLIIKNNGEQDE